MNSVVTTLAPSFLFGSSSFLQATRTSIKSWMCSKLGSIKRRPYELPALERLEKSWMSFNFVKIPSHILELAPLEHLKN